MKKLFAVCAFILAAGGVQAFTPVSVTPCAADTSAYSMLKINVGFSSEGLGINPYDYSQARVYAMFTRPGRKNIPIIAEGFYKGNDEYEIRFTPRSYGYYDYQVGVEIKGKKQYESAKYRVKVDDAPARGFHRVSSKSPFYFVDDDGRVFFALGMNMAWSVGDVAADYDKWIKKFSENGGNLVRIWTAPWSFEPERAKVTDYSDNEERLKNLDAIFEIAEKRGVFIQLCLVPHGELSEKVNPEWQINPYNKKNGGMLEKPSEFFVNKAARAAFKNKLRYIMARYGAYPSLFSYEFFNEADLTDDFNEKNVTAWHKEMSSFIKERDNYKRMVTTSFSNPQNLKKVWQLDTIDYTQTHIYGLTEPASELYNASINRPFAYNKPHIVGEYGIQTGDNFDVKNTDKEGVSLVTGLWGSVFSMSFGTAMPWNWEEAIDANSQYVLWKPVAGFVSQIQWTEWYLSPIGEKKVYYDEGIIPSPNNAEIRTVDAWGRAPASEFRLKPDGSITNPGALHAFLYGTGKPEMKNDPVFTTDCPRGVTVTVTTGKVSHDNLLCAYIDDVFVSSLTVNAKDMPGAKYYENWKIYQADTPKTFSFYLPRGNHRVKIANEGADWVKVQKIVFEGYVEPDSVPVFIAGVRNERRAYMYVKNEAFSWQNPSPKPLDGPFTIELYSMKPGNYYVDYMNTTTGAYYGALTVTVKGSSLKIPVKALATDCAIRAVRD